MICHVLIGRCRNASNDLFKELSNNNCEDVLKVPPMPHKMTQPILQERRMKMKPESNGNRNDILTDMNGSHDNNDNSLVNSLSRTKGGAPAAAK